MRTTRKAGLIGGRLPSFATLFKASRSGWQSANIVSTATKMTVPYFSSLSDGDAWYSFYSVGGSMEISRLMSVNGVMTKTRIGVWKPTGTTAYTSSINNDNTGLIGDQNVYAYHLSIIKFSIGADTVEKMFQQGDIGTVHYYYGSSYVDGEQYDELDVDTEDITAHDGVYYAAFGDYQTNGDWRRLWGVGNTQTPYAVALAGQVNLGSGSTWLTTRSPFKVSGDHCVPTADGTTSARVKSYTLMYFTETW